MYKSEPQIWNDIISIINSALYALKIENLSIIRVNQPLKWNNSRPCITLQKLNSRQYGNYFDNDYQTLTQEINESGSMFITQFKIGCLKTLKPNNFDDLTAFDILQQIKLFLDSDNGIKLFSDKNIFMLLSKDINQPVSLDENDQWESFPNYDISLQYTQAVQVKRDKIGAFDGAIKGV
jgi:hypothetical protein